MNQPQEQFEMTQQEIADSLGTNRSTINYYEKEALKKIKEMLKSRGFKASDFLETQEK